MRLLILLVLLATECPAASRCAAGNAAGEVARCRTACDKMRIGMMLVLERDGTPWRAARVALTAWHDPRVEEWAPAATVDLAQLSPLATLEEFDAGYSITVPVAPWAALPATGIRGLAGLRRLRLLCLPWPVGEPELEAVCSLPNLEELHLRYDGGKAGDGGPACFGNLKNLRRLTLIGSRPQEEVLPYLEPLRRLESVELALPHGGADAAHFMQLPNARKLHFRSTEEITDAKLARMRGFRSLRSLEIETANAKGLSRLAVLPHLETILVCEYDAASGAADISGLTGLKSIEIQSAPGDGPIQLDLPDGPSRVEGPPGVLRRLGPRAARHVVGVRVAGGGRWIPEPVDFSWLGAFPGLKELSLSDATGKDVKAIARLTALRELAIAHDSCSGVLLQDDGMRAIAGLRDLETLRIDPSSLTDSGMLALRSLTKLRRLVLAGGYDGCGGCAITTRGLENIWGLQELRVLWLDVSPQGINAEAALARMKDLGELEELTLLGDVPDAALAHLATVKRLRVLDLNGASGFTDEGLAALMDASPSLRRVKVTFSPRTAAQK